MKAAIKLVLLVAFCCSITVVRAADDPKTDPASPGKAAAAKSDTPAGDPEKKFKGRLPRNYSKLVSDTQKQKIYQIESDYSPKIKALRDQLSALTAQQDKEIRAVLTADQLKKLDELTAEAKAKRKTDKPAESATKAVDPAKPAVAPPSKPTETAPPLTK